MIINTYFILPLPNNHSTLWSVVVENANTVRKNNQQTKMIIKVPVGTTETHPILNGVQSYTHAEILTELQKTEWKSNI